MTIAEKVAGIMGNDGTNWKDEEGNTLEVVCLTRGAVKFGKDDPRTTNTYKYEFEDGSSIVDANGVAWDLGFMNSDCFCWEQVGHICGLEE